MMDGQAYKTTEELKKRPSFYLNDLEANIKKDIFRHLPKENQQKILDIKGKMQGTFEKSTKNEIPKDKAIKILEELSNEAHKLFQLPKKVASKEFSSPFIETLEEEKIKIYRKVAESKSPEEQSPKIAARLSRGLTEITKGLSAAITGTATTKVQKENKQQIIELQLTVDKERNKLYYEFGDFGPAEGQPLEKRIVIVNSNVSHTNLEKKVKGMLSGIDIKPLYIEIGSKSEGSVSYPTVLIYYKS